MGNKIRSVKRDGTKEILGYVMHEGEVINGKWYPPGNFKVVQGVRGEVYPIDPRVLLAGYIVDDDLLAELKETNGGKLD